MQEHPQSKEIPSVIHVVNVIALLGGSLILLLTAVVKTYQIAMLLPILGLLVLYWRYRTNPRVAACFFGMSMALVGWIIICEQLVTIDNLLGTQISRHVSSGLGMRLQSYVLSNHHTVEQVEREPCCDDPLTWHYRPGSRYRSTFDCPTCNEPYEIIVDETGYLNQQAGLFQHHQKIDVFLAGDSVMQGMGVPSVIELVRKTVPHLMWNLSIQAYGPQQKINALLTYALPKQPQWLIVEFYAGNDLPEAIRDDVCSGLGDVRCRHNSPTLHRLLAQHQAYQTIFDIPRDFWARIAGYSTENLTLATTRYALALIKTEVRARLAVLPDPSGETTQDFENGEAPVTSVVPWPPAEVREGQWLAYLKAGMAVTLRQYERLWEKVEGIDPKPTVILLYHPSPYELYTGIGVGPNPEADQASAFQQERLKAFAVARGWRYLDLTEPLRQEVRAHQVWLFGRYDTSHWSPEGTAIVAPVLSRELIKVMGKAESTLSVR